MSFGIYAHSEIQFMQNFYAWFTISAQLLSDSVSYNAYVAHIQNNALLYFRNIIHAHHCLCLQKRRRRFMRIYISLNKFTFTTFFFLVLFLSFGVCIFCELPVVLVLGIVKYEKTGSCGIT